MKVAEPVPEFLVIHSRYSSANLSLSRGSPAPTLLSKRGSGLKSALFCLSSPSNYAAGDLILAAARR